MSLDNPKKYCECDHPDLTKTLFHCGHCRLDIETIYEECSRLRKEVIKLKKHIKILETENNNLKK